MISHLCSAEGSWTGYSTARGLIVAAGQQIFTRQAVQMIRLTGTHFFKLLLA